MEIKNKTKKRSLSILALLGFKTKEDRAKMTNEDWNKFNASYQEKYGIAFADDLNSEDDEDPENENPNPAPAPEAAISPEMQQTILASLTEVATAAGTTAPTEAPKTQTEALNACVSTIAAATEVINQLAAKPETNAPAATVQGASISSSTFARVMGHTPHTETHLFGIENQFFARGNWWSDLVVSGAGKGHYTTEDAESFAKNFKKFGEALGARTRELQASNQIALLDYNSMIKGESMVDYSRVDTKLGEYTVRRMDTIIAYLRTLSSVSHIFPVVSNVQNETTAATAFFEELSQAYKPGYVFKGAIDFDGEKYRVNDMMFKFQFADPKALEKSYIGYLNREGSNPMKWMLFEWCIVHFGTLLFNEQQRRRVVGTKVPSQGAFPQPAMLGADGALRAIQRVEEELKVLPFHKYKQYDESTVLDYVRSFWAEVSSLLPNMNGLRLYMNEKHQLWYIDAYDAKYGKNTDYAGPNNKIRYYSPAEIIWVPNMDNNDFKMWITKPGNIENYEDVPNEMYGNFYFEQQMEQLAIASWWKEGAGVQAPGVQFDTLENLEKSKRKNQWLFTNYPVIVLDPDATKIDGTLGFEFETGENTAAAEIAEIENPTVERVYKIICGDIANVSTIAKAGKFEKIKSAWTPTAVGDYIKLYAELKEDTQTVNGKDRKVVVPTGNFLELERKVS